MNKYLVKVALKFSLIISLHISCQSVLALSEGASYRYESRYSPAGLLLAEISPSANGNGRAARIYRYEMSGRPTLVTAIEHGVLSYWYDESISPYDWGADFQVEYIARFTYDQYGRKIFAGKTDNQNVYKVLKQFGYDNRSRVECETVRMNENALTPWQNSLGACSVGTAGSYGPDRVTKYSYDDRDNVTKIVKAHDTDLAQDYATYTYSGYNKTSVKDANGNFTKYVYDNLNRLEYIYYPSKAQAGVESTTDYERFTYDANGNRKTWRRRNGKTIIYEYDALNRMWLKNIPGTTTQDVYAQYELTGVNTSATYGSFTGQGVKNNYNGFGDLLSSSNTTGGSNRTLTYKNDKHGNREYLYHPDNAYFRYFYDQRDRAFQIQANGSTVAWLNYSTLGQLDSIERNISRKGAKTQFDYDGIGRVFYLQQDFVGTSSDVTNTFTYNPASQLASNLLSNNQYLYGENNYRTGAYSVNGLNQYTAINGATLSYDANANLWKDGPSTTYLYDVENRLISVSGSVNATLTYDPLGRLFEVHVTSGTPSRRQFLYDGDALVAEYTSSTSNTPVARYLHGDGADVPLVQYNSASVTTAARRFLHANHQGSIIAHSDNNGNQIAINTYDAFGIPEVTNQGRFGYTGQIWLPELGLYHYKARMYEPRLGRFLQTDPVGYEDQMNLYAYVGNDPVNMVDPTGESGAAAGVIGAGAFFCSRSPACVRAVGSVIAGISGAVGGHFNESAETETTGSEGPQVSDRPPGPDGKSGSTGGPGEGKRFKPESADTKAGKEGVPCRYCGTPTTNQPGQPNSRERDHIDPKSRGGNNSSENEGDSCRTCNRSKGARNPDEWKPPEIQKKLGN